MWSLQTALTKALSDFGADSVYFDVIFSEKSKAGDDKAFAQAMKSSKNVYLPFAFQDRTLNERRALFPIEMFQDKIRGTGSINIYPDIPIRRFKLKYLFGTT